MRDYAIKYLNELADIIRDAQYDIIVGMVNQIKKVKDSGGRLFFLGVGGSAANASHAVNDFRKIGGIESYAITDNVAELTARVNDEGWDTCFSEWLKISNLNDKDAIVIFSVGGGSENTSQNIVKAIDLAKERNSTILSIVSRDGGYSKLHSDVCYLIPITDESRITPHAEEFQCVVWHLLVNMVKEFDR